MIDKKVSRKTLNFITIRDNEKFEIENEVDSVEITKNSNVRLRTIIKPYILPIIIISLITIVYAMIVYRKLGVWSVFYKTLMSIVAPQAILSSVYAVTRLPINRGTAIVAVIVYIASIILPMAYFSKNIEDKKIKN